MHQVLQVEKESCLEAADKVYWIALVLIHKISNNFHMYQGSKIHNSTVKMVK